MTDRDEQSRMIGYFVPTTETDLPSHRALKKLWQLLSDYRRMVAIVIAILVALSIVYVLGAQRIYRAETAMVAVSDKDTAQALESLTGQLGGLASLIGIDLDVDAAKREAIATLRSKSFLLSFIHDKRLLPVLYANRWDEQAGTWKNSWWRSDPTEQDAYKRMKKRVYRVTDDKTAGLIWIRIDWKDPQVAAEWANELAARANAILQARAIDEANKSLDFLEKELAKTTVVELRQAIHRLQEAQIRRVMLANVRQEYSFKVIDPAIAADSDDYVRPDKVLTLCLAFFGGLVIALIIAFWLDASRSRRALRKT
jgi:uncharacterized protein involved in exopolysaccharide biosynthesis